MEGPQADSVSGHRQFWQTDAANVYRDRGASSGAGAAQRGLSAAQGAHGPIATRLRAQRAAASMAVFHGRFPCRKHVVWQSFDRHDRAGATPAKHLEGSADGGHSATAIGAGGAGEFCGPADGQDAGEPELHGIERDDRFMRRTMWLAYNNHLEGVPRATPTEAAGRGDPARRASSKYNERRKGHGRADGL